MKYLKKILGFVITLSIVISSTGLQVQHVFAASITTASDTMSTVKINTNSNHDISFVTPTGIAAGATLTLTFQSDFVASTSLDFTDIDLLDNGSNVTLAAAPVTTTWGVVRTSATVITFTNGSAAVTAGHTIRIKIGTNATNQTTGVRQILNATTTGTKTVTVGGNFGDSGTISVQLITDDTVAITATVSQSISFSISSNSIAFGTLDSAAARYASSTGSGSATDVVAHTLIVATNAPTGYTITVQGATLTSAQNSSNTITANGASPAASSVGSEQFGIYATKTGGTNGTIATPYVTSSSFGYNATATSSATFASGSSATAAETYSLHYIANIAAVTEAGSYTASLNYVATANF